MPYLSYGELPTPGGPPPSAYLRGNSGPQQPQQQHSSSSPIQRITSESQRAQYIQHNKVVCIKVFSPSCGPCRQLAPMYEQFVAEFVGNGSKVVFLEEDIASLRQTKSLAEHVTAVPTFMLFNDGRLVRIITGGDLQKVASTLNDLVKW
jgi:thiol-disulfide isomerase/thioredoxin